MAHVFFVLELLHPVFVTGKCATRLVDCVTSFGGILDLKWDRSRTRARARASKQGTGDNFHLSDTQVSRVFLGQVAFALTKTRLGG